MLFYTFKQNKFQESLYSTKTYCLNDIDLAFLQSQSHRNISSLFASCILSYPSRDKSRLKKRLSKQLSLTPICLELIRLNSSNIAPMSKIDIVKQKLNST